MAFSDLKKKAGDIESIRQRVVSNQGGNQDEYLNLGIDQTRNGYIRVRLLPAPADEDSPMVSYSRFKFKNGSKTYSAYHLKNIGQNDPCQQYLSALWADGSEEAKKLYSERKQKRNTIVNLIVLEDKVKPDNNGWTGRYRPPAHIKKMIEEALNPTPDKFTKEVAESFNPFDIFGSGGGRDLIIRVTDKEGQNSYEKSTWAPSSSPLFGGDEAKMEETWKQAKSLYQFIDPSKYKSYDELAKMLVEVVGPNDKYIKAALAEWLEANPDVASKSSSSGGSAGKTSNRAAKEDTPPEDEKPQEEQKSETKVETKVETKKETKSTPAPSSSDDMDFDIDFDINDTPFD
ncbi:single-stranded DNA-binding protein [Rhizobium phage RHph_N34]|uniref:Single-stranded DNA-binding protein n=1 Tax=Rhizobium phage RHph_N34 TaxID=2509586 RepID=A0A7S5RA04_9CAUD|nr:single-stranded DNA-binding protein [Rhizobium phage RHph_N34]QIG73857.1 single-stranded DNA-binding protein [Rhizobium phage RHph_N34]